MNATNKSNSRGRPRKLDHDAGLNSALPLFLESGYDNVSIAMLCNKLGAPATSLYSTFGNKQQLFLKTFALYRERFFSSLDVVLNQTQSAPALFRNTLEFAVDYYSNQNRNKGCLILNGALFCSDKAIIAEVRNTCDSLLDKLKERLMELGSENSSELALVLVTLMRGMCTTIQSGSDAEQIFMTTEFFCTAFDC